MMITILSGKLMRSILIVMSVFISLLCGNHAFAATSSLPIGVVSLSGGGGSSGSSGGGASAAAGSAAVSSNGTVTPDLFSGTMSYSIPIAVPSGRKGMDPGLALTYQSNNGNGWVGVGWDLDVGAIERSTRNGINYSGDEFILRMDGSGIDLVSVAGEYRAKIEGSFLRIKKVGNYFEVTDKTGMKYFYGQDSASRQEDPADATRIFKWCLDKVEDTNGNYMTLSYFKDQGQIYLDRIDYAGNGSLPATNYVKFYRESRADAPDMYSTNFRVKTAYRLKTIDVIANCAGSCNPNEKRVRTYKLNYTSSNTTSRSLLMSFQQFGADVNVDTVSGNITNEATASKLPAFNLNYQNDLPQFQPYTQWGTGHSADDQLGDFNGDGKADVIQLYNGSANLWISDGDSFTYYPNVASGVIGTEQIGDFDGDGKADIVQFYNGTASVWLSTGTGFLPYQNWGSGHLASDMLGDFNGDGKTDVVQFYSGYAYIWLSTGSGFSPYTNWGSGHLASDKLGDFNGDGKTDVVQFYSGYAYVWLSTGSGFSPYTNWGSGHLASDMLGDFNGDGKTDVIQFYNNHSNVWLSSGPAPDLLNMISNGLGATTTIAYKPSTQYPIPHPQLPFPIQTVYSVTTNDGNTPAVVSTTTYDYQGGFFYIGIENNTPAKDFRGFNYVKVTGQAGPNGEQSVTETWFHQGNDVTLDNNPNVPNGYMKGKPYRTRVTDGQGHIYSETTTTYEEDADNPPAAPYFNPPQEVHSYVCDGDGVCGIHTKAGFTYDHTNGNILEVVQHGDVTTLDDDKTIVKTYNPNTTAWILGLPATETVHQGIGTTGAIVSRTTYYYDGTTDCSTPSTNQTPVKGNPTRIVRWLDGVTDPEVRMAYDSYGNLKCTRDANGNPPSSIEYDSSTQTFPIVKRNALN